MTKYVRTKLHLLYSCPSIEQNPALMESMADNWNSLKRLLESTKGNPESSKKLSYQILHEPPKSIFSSYQPLKPTTLRVKSTSWHHLSFAPLSFTPRTHVIILLFYPQLDFAAAVYLGGNGMENVYKFHMYSVHVSHFPFLFQPKHKKAV